MIGQDLEHLASWLVAVPGGDDQVAVERLDGGAHDQDVAIADARMQHGPPHGPVDVGGQRVADQVEVEVDLVVEEVLGWGREAQLDADATNGKGEGGQIDAGRA